MPVKRISDFNISSRGLLSGIYGNTRNSEYFIDNDLCSYNICKALYVYMKSEGYRVVFYNPTKEIGFYSYSEEDLAIFSGYVSIPEETETSNHPSHTHLQNNGKYVRHGEYTSYVPKIKTPMGKLKPRFGISNTHTSNTNTTSTPPAQQSQRKKKKNALVCHYPQIYLHEKGLNTFFKRYSSMNVFDEIFGFSDMHPQERLAVIFENPENIIPEQPDQVENKFSDISKVYGEEHRQLKLIVLFGHQTSGQLAAAFAQGQNENNGVFFRTSFATRLGLAVSNQSNERNRTICFAWIYHKKMKSAIGSTESES